MTDEELYGYIWYSPSSDTSTTGSDGGWFYQYEIENVGPFSTKEEAFQALKNRLQTQGGGDWN